jgi:hypothetical protein
MFTTCASRNSLKPGALEAFQARATITITVTVTLAQTQRVGRSRNSIICNVFNRGSWLCVGPESWTSGWLRRVISRTWMRSRWSTDTVVSATGILLSATAARDCLKRSTLEADKAIATITIRVTITLAQAQRIGSRRISIISNIINHGSRMWVGSRSGVWVGSSCWSRSGAWVGSSCGSGSWPGIRGRMS